MTYEENAHQIYKSFLLYIFIFNLSLFLYLHYSYLHFLLSPYFNFFFLSYIHISLSSCIKQKTFINLMLKIIF
jgi:hypothetical protein